MLSKYIRLGLLLVLVLSTTALFAQSSDNSNNNLQKGSTTQIDGVYDYPVKAGTDEWAALNTHDEMLKVTQIPKKYLSKMSTKALFESILNYPLLVDRMAFNSKQQGFDSLASNFNGLLELRTRKDAGTIVFSKYKTMEASVPENISLEEQGNLSFRFEFIETLLAQDFVLDSLTEGQKDELLEEILSKNDVKEKNSDVYGFFGDESSAFLLGRLLIRTDIAFAARLESEASLGDFVSNGSQIDLDGIRWIINEAQKRSSGVIGSFLERSSSVAAFSAIVTTPRGSSVPVIGGIADYTASQRTACNNDVSRAYPQATREADCTKIYNCHSYAWYSQSTSNPYWMNSPSDDIYWNDGSYVGSYAVGAANRKVSYASDDHSAITVNATQFRSKWGSLARMLHNYGYCPYNSSNLRYYELQPATYSLSASTTPVRINRGATANFYISTSTTSGFRGTVSFYVIGLPGNQVLPGTGFNPQSVNIQANNATYATNLKIYTNSSTPRGNFTIRIEGRSGSKTISTNVYLVIS